MTAALDSLVTAVQQAATRHQQQGAAAKAGLNSSRGVSRVNSRQGRGGTSERGRQAGSMLALLERCGSDVVVPGGDVAWVKGVVVRLKELLLESDRWVDCWQGGVCVPCWFPVVPSTFLRAVCMFGTYFDMD